MKLSLCGLPEIKQPVIGRGGIRILGVHLLTPDLGYTVSSFYSSQRGPRP